MLDVNATAHREYLTADTPNQRLFIMLRLRPKAEAIKARPSLSIAFVVDTSGSMREVVTEPTERTGRTIASDGKKYEVVLGAKSKLDLVIESFRNIFENPGVMTELDKIAIVRFDDVASTVLPFTGARNVRAIVDAAEGLDRFSGGTHMGAGLREGQRLLSSESGSQRLVLLSDGNTFDEDLVNDVTEDLFQQHVPVTVIGVGADLNLDLLTKISDRTQGRMMDIVPDNLNPQPPSVRASDLPREILDDVKRAGTEVVTDMRLSLKLVQGVEVERVTRVFPVQSEVDLSVQPYALGNAEASDETIFVIEATLPARPPSRVRIAQLGLTYQVPGAGYRGEIPPSDIVVELTRNEALAAQIDVEVMQYVQQRNVERLIEQAALESRTDPEKAKKTMQQARSITVRLGNSVMTKALDRALDEIGSSKTMSLGTAKTLRIGAKTQTMKLGESPSGIPSEEDIRRLTGE